MTAGRQGKGGPSLGWVTGEESFLTEASLLVAILHSRDNLELVTELCKSVCCERKSQAAKVKYASCVNSLQGGGGDQSYGTDAAQRPAGWMRQRWMYGVACE